MSPKILNKHYLDAFFTDMNITDGRTKEPYRQLINKKHNIERYIGANKYYEMDYQDENYKYNKLRTKLIKKGVIK